MPTKPSDQKAALIVALDKEISAAKTLEDKLLAGLAAIDIGESYMAHARAAIHDLLKSQPDGQLFELAGIPYKKTVLRGKQKEGEPEREPRYSLRCGITKEVRLKYDFEKKTANSP